jgi:hypothetical protein
VVDRGYPVQLWKRVTLLFRDCVANVCMELKRDVHPVRLNLLVRIFNVVLLLHANAGGYAHTLPSWLHLRDPAQLRGARLVNNRFNVHSEKVAYQRPYGQYA